VLGCFLEGFAMLVLTLPIFFPVIVQLGIRPYLVRRASWC
jgi:TRAP-type C4-dicarboxylate transport system permease large subunit